MYNRYTKLKARREEKQEPVRVYDVEYETIIEDYNGAMIREGRRETMTLKELHTRIQSGDIVELRQIIPATKRKEDSIF